MGWSNMQLTGKVLLIVNNISEFCLFFGYKYCTGPCWSTHLLLINHEEKGRKYGSSFNEELSGTLVHHFHTPVCILTDTQFFMTVKNAVDFPETSVKWEGQERYMRNGLFYIASDHSIHLNIPPDVKPTLAMAYAGVSGLWDSVCSNSMKSCDS